MDDRLSAVPKAGEFKITLDNSPISLEGKSFSYSQIMAALKNCTFRPGMRFRHKQARQAEFVLTETGLMPFHKKLAGWPSRDSSSGRDHDDFFDLA